LYGEVIVVGVLVSLVFAELTGLSAAGLIVAGYFALNIGSPLKLCLTLAVALAALGIYQLLSRWMILYGRRRFYVMVLLSLLAGWCVTALPIPAANLGVVGYLIPGIIAKECDRQGILITLLSLAAATAVTVLICLLLGVRLF